MGLGVLLSFGFLLQAALPLHRPKLPDLLHHSEVDRPARNKWICVGLGWLGKIAILPELRDRPGLPDLLHHSEVDRPARNKWICVGLGWLGKKAILPQLRDWPGLPDLLHDSELDPPARNKWICVGLVWLGKKAILPQLRAAMWHPSPAGYESTYTIYWSSLYRL